MQKFVVTAIMLSALSCSGDETADTSATETATSTCPETDFGLQCPAPPQLEDGTDFSQWEVPTCGLGMMPVFGTSGCMPVGTPCPSGDWPESLPEGSVKYVTPGGTGDGSSPENAAGSIQSTIRGSVWGATVALSKGVFQELVDIERSVHLIGACARDTHIDSTGLLSEANATVQITRDGAVTLENLTVSGPRRGIEIWDTTEPSALRGIMVDQVEEAGILISMEAVVEASTLVIENTQGTRAGMGGQGLVVQQGASLTVTHALLESNRDVGLLGLSPNTTINATDLVIQNTQARQSDGNYGWAVEMLGGSSLTLNRALLTRNEHVAMYALNAGTEITASNIVISHTQSRLRDGAGGRGVNIQEGASLELSRAYLFENRDTAIACLESPSSITATDITIVGTQSHQIDLKGGQGLTAQDGSYLNVTRARITRNKNGGVMGFDSDTTIELTDIIVEHTESMDSDGTFGRGVNIQDGASLTMQRALLSNNRDTGLYISGEGTKVLAEDIAVAGTRVVGCFDAGAPNPCELGFGDGILIMGGADATLNNFSVTGNARVGMYVFDATGSSFENTETIAGSPTLNSNGEGSSTGNQIGLNLVGPQANITSWLGAIGNMTCKENHGTVDGCYDAFAELPVPDPSDILGDLTDNTN